MAGLLLRQSQARAWRTDQMDSEAMDQHHLEQLRTWPGRPFHTQSQEDPHRQQRGSEIFRPARQHSRQDGIFANRRRWMRVRRRRELLRQQSGRTKAEFPGIYVVQPVLVPPRPVRLNGWWRKD